MAIAWRFDGEFRRGRKEVLTLSILVVGSTFEAAEEIARKKLVGADKISSAQLPRDEVSRLQIRNGEVWL
jgi:hypothetical protein